MDGTAVPAPAATHRPDGKRDLRRTGTNPDHWYPIARGSALKRGKAIAARFAGDPVVLVRTDAGTVFALEDRCAHRQVPLHAGVVTGDCLQCCYHGWTYDASGRCVNIPYMGKDKLVNAVRSYPCREAYGLIFIYPGDNEREGFTRFPDVPGHADRRYRTRYLDRVVDCHYSFMHENLIDMNHQFLHRRLMGSIQTRFLEMRRSKGSIEVDYTFSRVKGRQPWGEKFMLGRRPQPTDGRARDLMKIRTDYPYQTLRFWTAGSEEPALDLWNVYVPVDRQQRQNRTFGLMMIRRPAIPGLIHLIWPIMIWFTEGIFAEDRWIVEEEQKAFDRQGRDENNEVFPVVAALREVLREGGVPLEG